MTTTDLLRTSMIELALRFWGAAKRRERALEPAIAVFEAAVPERIRTDERFQKALEDAATAESLEQAMVWHERETQKWAANAIALLRAIKAADADYEQQVGEALDVYRDSFTQRGGGTGTDGLRAE